MAFNGYDIRPAEAHAAIKGAADRFDDIDGIEDLIDGTLDAAGTASNETQISSALNDVFDNFARPFVVTMIKSGRQTFTMGHNLVTTYQQADEDAGAYSVKAALERCLARSHGSKLWCWCWLWSPHGSSPAGKTTARNYASLCSVSLRASALTA